MNRTLKGMIVINAFGVAIFVIVVALAPPRVQREAGPSAFPVSEPSVGPGGTDAGREG